MGLLSAAIGHVTGWSGRARGSELSVADGGVPLPHASSRAPIEETATAEPAARFRKSRRETGSANGRRSRGCTAPTSNRLGEAGEVVEERLHVVLRVLDREHPLLGLPPRRQEHPAAVLH